MRTNSLVFSFNGINSVSKGVVNVATSTGLFTDNVIGSRDIRGEKIEGRPAVYYYGINEETMTFDVRFAIQTDNGEITQTMINDIFDWLLVEDGYRPLIFANQPNKVYYVIFDGVPQFTSSDGYVGYIDLSVTCLYPYPVTADKITTDYQVITSMAIDITNEGHRRVSPDIYILKNNTNGTINISNTTNNSEFEITLNADDEINIDGLNKIIWDINTLETFRADSKSWLYFEGGANNIVVTGDCTIAFKFTAGTFG